MTTTTTTRRAAMGCFAAAPMLLVSARAAAIPDPILAAIEAHRTAVEEADARHDEHAPNYEKHIGCHLADTSREMTDAGMEALKAGGNHPEFLATSKAWNAACEVAQEAARVLAFTEPTTLAGLAEAMTYLADHMAALDTAPEDDIFLDDGLFSAVFAFTLSEAAQMLAMA